MITLGVWSDDYDRSDAWLRWSKLGDDERRGQEKLEKLSIMVVILVIVA